MGSCFDAFRDGYIETIIVIKIEQIAIINIDSKLTSEGILLKK